MNQIIKHLEIYMLLLFIFSFIFFKLSNIQLLSKKNFKNISHPECSVVELFDIKISRVLKFLDILIFKHLNKYPGI